MKSIVAGTLCAAAAVAAGDAASQAPIRLDIDYSNIAPHTAVPMVRTQLTRERWQRMVQARAVYSREETQRRVMAHAGKNANLRAPVVPQVNYGDYEYLGQVSIGSPLQVCLICARMIRTPSACTTPSEYLGV
jgi:hypothetical protein